MVAAVVGGEEIRGYMGGRLPIVVRVRGRVKGAQPAVKRSGLRNPPSSWQERMAERRREKSARLPAATAADPGRARKKQAQ